MTEDWMIDVLADLRKFANNNSMVKLTEQLDDAIHIAATEMAGYTEDMVIVKPDCGKKSKFIRPAFIM